MPILFLILLFPVVEIMLLVALASHIGFMATLLYLILSALLGSWMLRNQELGALLTAGSVVRQGSRVSIYSLLWPVRYALAGVLFIIPGILSEIAAVALLLPLKGPAIRTAPAGPAPDSDVIEGEFQRVDTPPTSLGHPEDQGR
jgi:UPF0716 protein FxsA